MRPLLSVQELSERRIYSLWCGKTEVLAVVLSDGVRVFSGMCPHQGGPLAQGELGATSLTCPWHGCTFDLREGNCIALGTCQNVSNMKLRPLPFKVEGGMIYVDLGT